ncbi:MAG TPA: helix-turn-helix domain-containing protein [Gemmatimonadaceae bacterium]|nr:helix-turn-helix domain-containing protein [Gemmatimonadaceae bacterium]
MRPPAKTVYTVRSLEQARILANPLRVRLLREFVDEPRTTMQVAERLGEKAPKLYRHVQALVDAGLLQPKGERKKRGTTERYLQAVAARFEVDASIFASAGRGTGASGPGRQLTQMIRTLFANTEEELLAHCADPSSEEEPPVVARILVRGSPAEVARIQRHIMSIVQESHSRSRKRAKDGDVELSGLIAFRVAAAKRD